MKNLFHGHFKPSESQFKGLWSESIFAFDANIILNLYRYSESTRNELLKVIGLLSGRVWLPFQAAEEYFRNRITTIGGQAKEYDKIADVLTELVTNLGNKKRHPFLSDSIYSELESLSIRIKAEFSESKRVLGDKIYTDEIQDKVSTLFEDKVGDRYEQKVLDAIYKEGQVRYEAEVAPGFRDGVKDKSGNLYRKFGDLIIWNELIDKAKKESKSIIFITDDKKDDWWLEYSGKTIGPLPSLIQEFKEKSSQDFYMYTADRFMQSATQYLSEQVEEEVIDELKQFRQEEENIRDSWAKVLDDLMRTSQKSSFKIVNEDGIFDGSHRLNSYKVASEEEVLKYLIDYTKMRMSEEGGFVGLKHFVTSYLAKKGIEINHAYATINNLKEQNLISLYDHSVGDYSVKAIRILHE